MSNSLAPAGTIKPSGLLYLTFVQIQKDYYLPYSRYDCAKLNIVLEK
jgi:hypothetical protein